MAMRVPPTEKEKATAGTAMARSQNHQTRLYLNRDAASRRELLERAADVILLLQHPLGAVERVGFCALLERRMERVYEGAQR